MRVSRFALALAALSSVPASSFGAAATTPTNEELKRQLDVLAAEIQNLRTGEAVPAKADQSSYDLSPAASKVYRTSHGISVGGYGQVLYENHVSSTHAGAPANEQDQIDLAQAVIYLGYKFDEHWIFNSETEFEHATTELAGNVNVEFAYLDYLNRPELNFRSGLVLMPVGLLNEIHEPTTYLGTHRPEVEQFIIPSTWSEIGFGIFGDLGPVSYRWYLTNGLNASAFDASEGIREGRQLGSEAIAEGWLTAIRADYTGTPGLLVGGSAVLGSSSTPLDPAKGGGVSIPTHLYEVHIEYKWRALQFRALGAYNVLSKIEVLDALTSAPSIGNKQRGYYIEAGYDVCSGEKYALIPFARYEDLNTQYEMPTGLASDPANHRKNWTFGANYKPIDQIVFKADYQIFLLGDLSGVNQWNLAVGYVF